jgi:hypothetical protein
MGSIAMRTNVPRAGVAVLMLLAARSGDCAQYADPKLLDVPWGNYSFIRQGWRGYLETVPAVRYRDGLGVVWGQTPPNRSADEVAASLAWAGFRRVRLEIPWGSVRWDETALDDASAARTTQVLGALKHHHLRPLILLNANHLQPCPVRWRTLSVERTAAAGNRTIVVAGDLEGVQRYSATLMSLADGATAGPLIASYSPVQGARGLLQVQLSKPLARAVTAGATLRLAILRYPPLYPAGTPAFELTAAGWLRYVGLIVSLLEKSYGSDDFDIEIWNELTFSSAFLDVGNYGDSEGLTANAPEAFHPGGRAWELANRTVQFLKRDHPDIRVIWGFSNTTFFHVPIAELPPRLDGQSYHPYGTSRRCYADLVRNKRNLLLDDYVPPGCVVQPEGYAHAWQQTESLLRFLAPAARRAHPPGSLAFQHYITEHGFSPAETGIVDAREAERTKQKFLLRAPLFWLNKGLTALYVYDAYEEDDSHWGVLAHAGGISSGMRALHCLAGEFAGAVPLESTRPLSIQITREGPGAGVLPGDPRGKYLPQQDAAAFLPFQVNATKFLIGAYVMTQDFPQDLPPQRYQLSVSGVDGRNATVTYYSPQTNTMQPVAIIARTAATIVVRLGITDVPNLVEIQESQPVADSGGT